MRNRFHSLCPYFAMFPETFAEAWIKRLTRRGDWVLDPFSGRGTTPLSALLLERRAIASDINDVAYCITKAKTNAPSLRTLMARIDELEASFDARHWAAAARALPEFFGVAFSGRTLQQLMYLRQKLEWRTKKSDGMFAGLVLGALHGDVASGGYLSNQMPRTISTKPAYSLRYWAKHKQAPPDRDVFDIVRQWAAYRYKSALPVGQSHIMQIDVRKLSNIEVTIPKNLRCVVTSPPYFDTTDFEEDQWLRRWFLGAGNEPKSDQRNSDDRHRREDRYWRFIADTWRSLGSVLAKGANVVVRIGGRRLRPDRIRSALAGAACFSGRKVELVSWDVSKLKNRQTRSFRPNSDGIGVEIDCHFHLV
ncbi:MAG: hypothetical protein IT449_04340 [Phycisphaerales bacterium]|nr:hypothetical protein [Phycisphaerales bacterium]